MRITLLGHASVLVKMAGATCLMDPVFFDPFEEGAVVSCPERVVFPDRIPPIDILIISHRHPDHFDLASLDRLSRDCDAICPADPLIVYGLRGLGFKRIHPVEAMGEISSTDFELYPTRSEAEVREFGMIFKDRSGVFFNQVDTFLAPVTIDSVLTRFGKPDLMFAMYASQNFEFFDSLSPVFPYDIHRQNLENVIRMAPQMAAPGSAGFRFRGDHQWLNAFLFPISAERFVSDLRRLAPSIETCIARPGDVLEITGAAVRHLAGASNIAKMTQDDSRLIDFNPAAPIPPLTDPNPDGYSSAELDEITGRFITEMRNFVFGEQPTEDKVVGAYLENRVRDVTGLVFPDGSIRWRRFDFGARTFDLSVEDRISAPADIVHRIAASALAGWIEKRKSFFYVRAYSRRFSTLYRSERDGASIRLRPLALPDLLMHYLLNVAPGSETAARRRIDLELEALERSRRNR
ncbi:MAG: MBL fold metallo-hydrolase [Candidatus Binataceae bacterium]